MHRWVRGITVGVGGVALVAATFGAGMSPAGADDPSSDANADAVVWNDQFATVDVNNEGTSSTGGNTAESTNDNMVVIGQAATADASGLFESRDEIIGWFYSEGFADWSGVDWLVDTGFQVIPGSPVVLPVLGGSATNLVGTINNTAQGIATIVTGNATVSNSAGVTLGQTFAGNDGATANADSTGGNANAYAEVGNSQGADVNVSNSGSSSSGGNSASTSNSNAVVIGQGASAGAEAATNGNASNGGGGGSVEGGTASNTANSVTNTASGQSSIQTGNATTNNSANVNVTQSNTGNGGATANATSTAPEGED